MKTTMFRTLAAAAALTFTLSATHAAGGSADVYRRTMQRLDADGEMLMFLNTDGVGPFIMKQVGDLMALGGEEDPEAKAMLGKIDAFLAKAGLYDVQGMGLSSRQRDDGYHDIKYFIARRPGTQGRIWDLVGKTPVEMESIGYFTRDDVLSMAVALNLPAAWALVKDAVSEFGGETAAKQLDAGVAQLKEKSGLDIEGAIAGSSGDLFLSVSLSSKDRIALPFGEGRVEMPEPGIVLGFVPGNTGTPERIAAMMFGEDNKPTIEKAGGTEIRYGAAIQGMPIPVQPAFAQHGRFVLIASTPKALKAALAAKAGKGGLGESAEFRAMGGALPVKANSFSFMSKRLMGTVTEVMGKVMPADEAGADPDLVLLKMQEWMNVDASLTLESVEADGYWSRTVSAAGLRKMIVASALPLLVMGVASETMSQDLEAGTEEMDGEEEEFDPDLLLHAVEEAKAEYAKEHGGKNARKLEDLAPYLGDVTELLPDGASITINIPGVPPILRMPDGSIHTLP